MEKCLVLYIRFPMWNLSWNFQCILKKIYFTFYSTRYLSFETRFFYVVSSVQCNDISLQILLFHLKMYLKIQFAENVSYYIRRMPNYVFFNFLDTIDHCVKITSLKYFDFSYKNYKRRNWKFYRQNPFNNRGSHAI